MLFVGRDMGTSVVVVVIVSFFPVMVNLMRGLRDADVLALELMHVYGATRWQQIWMVRAPSSLPFLFTGLRVAGANAILGALLAEWITGSPGLGLLILESGDLREVELLWAAVLVTVAIALAVFAVTSAAEKAVLQSNGNSNLNQT
jgi:ABC-type nitrate/sulfonate/bicarbonate transport system permease component